ncbi:transmembrane protein 229B-like [Liasis olivaceus]
MGSPGEPLSALSRWYIYAIHGYFSEVMFTATWDFILDQDWRFRGVTSVWALFIYGTCGLVLEQLYLRLKLRGDCCLLTRCTLYTACIYLWQLAAGCLLRCFGACPWDHSQLRYNVLGLVALEHGLLWFVGSLLLERLVIANALRLRLGRAWKPPRRPAPRFELTHD